MAAFRSKNKPFHDRRARSCSPAAGRGVRDAKFYDGAAFQEIERKADVQPDITPLTAAAREAATGEAKLTACEPAALHTSVLLEEVLPFFEPVDGFRCLDATLGMGGHAEAVLLKAREQGVRDVQLLGLDRDASALALAAKRLKPFGGAVHTRHTPFSGCVEAVRELGWEDLDFILADIGVSSLQIDLPERGFSFMADGPLDMRMDRSRGKSAECLVNDAPVAKLKDIIQEFGEEPMAGRIARAIDDARAQKRITGTLELARIVEAAYPAKWRATARNHPATRTFQALRMAVNDELGELENFLRDAVGLLKPGGRIAVISFHSLEDRMVKHFFRGEATGCVCPSHVPYCVCGHKAVLRLLTRKPVGPLQAEVASNPRAGSAKLRVAEKLP